MSRIENPFSRRAVLKKRYVHLLFSSEKHFYLKRFDVSLLQRFSVSVALKLHDGLKAT